MSKNKKRLVYHSAQEAVSKRHSETKSWKVVSSELGGLNRGYLSKVARGGARASDHLIGLINRAYDQRLPFNSKPATPCARCGSVHVTKRCTAVKSPRRYDGGVVRWNRIERPLMTAMAALYANRGVGEARYRIGLKRTLDALTG